MALVGLTLIRFNFISFVIKASARLSSKLTSLSEPIDLNGNTAMDFPVRFIGSDLDAGKKRMAANAQRSTKTLMATDAMTLVRLRAENGIAGSALVFGRAEIVVSMNSQEGSLLSESLVGINICSVKLTELVGRIDEFSW